MATYGVVATCVVCGHSEEDVDGAFPGWGSATHVELIDGRVQRADWCFCPAHTADPRCTHRPEEA